MELDRKTLENDEEYLRQISEEIDFEKDDYKEYIDKTKEVFKMSLEDMKEYRSRNPYIIISKK